MKKVLFFLLFLPIVCLGQTYKYIGVEDGLSNRRVYCIQKDKKGYMWFLTHEGIDRYNGKEFKQYKLIDNGKELNSLLNLNWLYIDRNNELWEIGKKGKIFHYDPLRDEFFLEYKLPEEEVKDRPAPVSYSFIDNSNTIWLCNETKIFLYDTKSKKTQEIENRIKENITSIEQIDDTHFFIGTEQGIHHAQLKNGALHLLPCAKLDHLAIQINELYYHKPSRKLFIGTFERGVFVYDMNLKQSIQPKISLTDVSITCIKPFDNKELLIATDGTGVYKLNVSTYETEPYIIADYNSPNGMNGNSINDLYIDNEQRIWLANYPIGITVRNNRYSRYNWIKHSIGNKQSLINNQVNAVIEDSEGDMWYGTNNGISLYNSKTDVWHSFMSSFEKETYNKNHIFTTICEVAPGIIWAGGYSSGIYEINKKTLQSHFFTPSSFSNSNIRPDKYIRDIVKDSNGEVWSGGYYNLKCLNPVTKSIRLYPNLNSVTAIVEKDRNNMWIGTATGLYLLNKKSGKYCQINLPIESTYIYSLYQSKNKLLYIGTSGSGLLIYDPEKPSFTHYYKENCALISNNIYTILSDEDKNILISTENGLTNFQTNKKTFQNWTKEQGLMSNHFNANSGTLRKNGCFVFGSANGVIEFSKDMTIPKGYSSKMVFSNLKIFYQTVYPGDKGSPLTTDIDDTKELKLSYDQNIFSMDVSSINYDYPSNVLYSWKLEGFYDEWSRPSTESIIRFTNLNPGRYHLHIRAVSSEDKRVVLEERHLAIDIARPAWLSIWAMLIYAIILGLIAAVTIRIIILRKQRKISDEKIHFFINTAHDIRTPLTLIKAPLEELRENESLTENGVANMNTALRNVNALLRLTTNLINFEKADVYSSGLYISEYELNTYLTDTCNTFRPYSDVKHIQFTYESNFRYLNVWIDKEKMDSILKNIISNALKYTPEGGSVRVFACESNDYWSVEVSDTGIGIPSNEQKKLFKIHFRGSNAINSKITGSGIGLMLVWKLVNLHKGKISLSSVEHKGSSIKVTFPKDSKQFHKAHLASKPQEVSEQPSTVAVPNIYETVQQQQTSQNLQRILVVEDNDELRNYLTQTLSDIYNVQTTCNGKEALAIVKEYKPTLIISDIMMPEMRGDDLCIALKNDIETSHIPIILLTALNDEKDQLEGLKIGADDYLVKPFNIGILKAKIGNLLTNRALLRNKYANLEVDNEEVECTNCQTTLDYQFISSIKNKVEDNLDNSDFNVDTLCTMLHMSRTSFYNKLKALTDQAPGDYIRLIRLKHAAKLLKTGSHTITEIAEMTGFSDAKYFREVFKKHYNVSPSKYSKEGNGEKEEKTKESN